MSKLKESLQEEETYSPKKSSRKLESIDTAQLEYTAEKLFTYGTVVVAVIAVYASIIYMGVQQLKK
jgi:cell division protein FtsL